jgi:hypothetical protein
MTNTQKLVAALLGRPPVPCSLCGDPVHQVSDLKLDEFAWVDAHGSRSGTDTDLRHLTPDPYAHLKWLADEFGTSAKGKTVAMPIGRAREYSMLKVRLEMSGTSHQHQVFKGKDLQPWPYGPPPVHCAWPMRLAPSGWVCRQCPFRGAGVEAAGGSGSC